MISKDGEMMTNKITTTSLFEVYFSRNKEGEKNKKFSPSEKKEIINIIKLTETCITKIISFSRTSPTAELYRIPIIFEKVSKTVFHKKHANHHALLNYPPIGTIWNKTVKYEGIEIKAHTGIISLCPTEMNDMIETVSHEIIHAYMNSFLMDCGVNHHNHTYFLEGLTEWMTQLVYRTRETKE